MSSHGHVERRVPPTRNGAIQRRHVTETQRSVPQQTDALQHAVEIVHSRAQPSRKPAHCRIVAVRKVVGVEDHFLHVAFAVTNPNLVAVHATTLDPGCEISLQIPGRCAPFAQPPSPRRHEPVLDRRTTLDRAPPRTPTRRTPQSAARLLQRPYTFPR